MVSKEMSAPERNAQPFSTQSGGQQRKTVGKFVDAFEAAGHDLGALFAHFIEHSQVGAKHAQDAKQSIKEALRDTGTDADKTLDQLMETIRDLHSAKTTNDREKLRIMSLVAPIFTRAELLRRGFKVSNDAFANARKHAANVGAGEPVPAGGRPRSYGAEMQASVEEFCNLPQNSVVNPVYTTAYQSLDPSTYSLEDAPMMEAVDAYGNTVLVPCNLSILDEHHIPIHTRILVNPISVIFHNWQELHPESKMTYQAFRSMLPAHIGKRSRDGDDGDRGDAMGGANGSTPKQRKRSRSTTKPASMDPSINSNILQTTDGGIPSHLTMPPIIDHTASSSVGPIPTHDSGLPQELVHHMQPVAAEEEEADLDTLDGAPPKKRSKLEERK